MIRYFSTTQVFLAVYNRAYHLLTHKLGHGGQTKDLDGDEGDG